MSKARVTMRTCRKNPMSWIEKQGFAAFPRKGPYLDEERVGVAVKRLSKVVPTGVLRALLLLNIEDLAGSISKMARLVWLGPLQRKQKAREFLASSERFRNGKLWVCGGVIGNDRSEAYTFG